MSRDDLDALVIRRKGKIPLCELGGLPQVVLHRIARALLNWNCAQPVSDAIHQRHYAQFIHPIHARLDQGGAE